MPTLDARIQHFRRRVAFSAALSRGVRDLALGFFAWGVVTLVSRVGSIGSREALLWGLAGLLPIVGLALVTGFKTRPSERAVRALLDRHNGSGGLVMAAGELELGGWRESLDAVGVPRLRVHLPWGMLAGAAVFASAAFWVPVRSPGPQASRPLAIGEEVAELAERIEILKEEGVLDEERADSFDAELRSLEAEARGEDPAVTWQTLDHLREMTDRTVAEVAEAALTEGQQLAVAETVAEALSAADGQADTGRLAEAMAELSALTARTAAESRLLDGALSEKLAAGAGERGELGKLLDALKRGQGSLNEKLERLYAEGLIDFDTLWQADLLQAKRASNSDPDALAAFLAENDLSAASGFCRGERAGQGNSGRPGEGGISRGRGDAAMTWGDPSSEEGARFQQQVLDPASLAALRESQLLGLTAADPALPGVPSAEPAASTVDPPAVGGGAAHTHTLLPRHRGAVRRYFDRPAGSP